MPAPPPPPGRYRLEASFGYAQGNYDGRLKMGTSDRPVGMVSDSAFGSDGRMIGVAAWRDRTILDDLSVGVEYLRFRNKSELTLSAPEGLALGLVNLNDPITAPVMAKLRADLGLLNFAYRPALSGSWHPFVGAGIGVGYGSVSGSVELSSPLLTDDLSHPFSASSLIAGVQGFFGFSADLTDHLYAHMIGRMVLVTARPLGMHQQFQDMALGAGLGWRF